MKKILIIDDEKFLRRTIVSALRQEGFETLETENGAAGLELARSRLPDLILCDVKMERMDGYATLSALRNDPAIATIPFILMTAVAERSGMRHGMALGADDYLPKPFSVDDLVAAVNARLAKQNALRLRVEQKLSGLCSNISSCLPHALFTPLNGILGFSALLRSDAATLSLEDTVEMADAINVSARELHRVIQNYLTFARIELLSTNEHEIAMLRSRRTIVTQPMMNSMTAEIASKAGRNPDVLTEVAEARVMISEDYFRKIVEELLGNALKFSSAGSSIKVVTRVDRGGFVLTVTDRGLGMTLDQIAESGPLPSFNRHIESSGGAGLGLLLARCLAEVHGGNLKLRSELGTGTTVEVRLPAVGAGL